MYLNKYCTYLFRKEKKSLSINSTYLKKFFFGNIFLLGFKKNKTSLCLKIYSFLIYILGDKINVIYSVIRNPLGENNNEL